MTTEASCPLLEKAASTTGASRRLLIPGAAVLEQRLDDGRVGQGAQVAQLPVALRYLAQHAPHDLAGARLGQAGRVLQIVGSRERGDPLPH